MASRTRARWARYQLNKRAAFVLASGHPWIFRKHMSSAASIFEDGQWLQLVDGGNRVVGHGFYQRGGAIAIRVLARGPKPLTASGVLSRLQAAVARRAPLQAETNAFRVVHGENDRLPAVTADLYDRVAVVSSYAAGADPLGRLVARHLAELYGLRGIQWRLARRRLDDGTIGSAKRVRVLSGEVPERVEVREGEQRFAVDLESGQKSGAFLDLRGLRRWLRASNLEGLRVLDGFSYTGSLGRAAASAGAVEVWHVDASARALAIGQAETSSQGSHRWIEADVFEWLPELDASELFDLAILDPPQMTSRARQVPAALAAYDRLYRALAGHVRPGGTVVACCCTSRIDEATLKKTVQEALGAGFSFAERLPPEIDHPVRFAEADYLKVLVYRR